jgi:hypothetical protein
VRYKRREDWHHNPAINREMWEELLDAIERRLPRREGVTDWDLDYVKQAMGKLKPSEDLLS